MEVSFNEMRKPRIRLLSISDCRDKTGIATFIKIFRQKSAEGKLPGYHFDIDCYRDFPEDGTVVPIPDVKPLAAGSARPEKKSGFKQGIKEAMLGNAFGAFLLFLLILCKRGLVVAVKSRLRGAADIYFHQDFFTALWGQLLLSRQASNILVLHSGADPLRHLFIIFRGMKDTGFERVIRHCFGWVLRKQDMVVTLSLALANEMRDTYGIQKAQCIYNTAETLDFVDRPALKRDSPLELVAVGSLQLVKGFDILLQGIASIPEPKRSRLRLIIVGEGEERTRLEQMISSSGLSEVVILAGNSNNVPRYLAGADVFVLSSRDEGMPMAVLEAMQTGLPLISTKVGTIPEVLDESACLFVEKTPEHLAAAIEAVLDGKHEIRTMGKESRRIYEKTLSMDRFLTSYLSLFDAVPKVGHQIWR